MAKHNRDTLKNYFREGALPSSAHFADLIDSSLNMREEGFDKTPEDGLKIASLENDDQLISFYHKSVYGTPLWTVSYGEKIDSLLFKRSHSNVKTGKTEYQPVLTLDGSGNVGVNSTNPQQSLDVGGVVRSQGRMGGMFSPEQMASTEQPTEQSIVEANILADGNWHQITPILEGCHAFEIVAGVGIQWTGRYAMVRAIAMNTCDPRSTGVLGWLHQRLPFLNRKNPIRCQHAYYRSTADKLRFKWVSSPNNDQALVGDKQVRRYYLAVKTNTDYGEGICIRYHITQLWFDNYMDDGRLANDEARSDGLSDG